MSGMGRREFITLLGGALNRMSIIGSLISLVDCVASWLITPDKTAA